MYFAFNIYVNKTKFCKNNYLKNKFYLSFMTSKKIYIINF